MKIPLFPLDVVLLPGAALPLHIFEERYREMFRDCMATGLEFGVVRAQEEGMSVVGCSASIGRILHRYPDGRFDVMCRGERRFEIEMLDDSRSYLQAEVDWLHDEGPQATRSDRELCAAMHFEVIERSNINLPMPPLDLDRPIAYSLASVLPTDLDFQQQMLATRSDAERTRKLCEFYEVLLNKLRTEAVNGSVQRNGHVM
ncbi:MAG: LON peptidase substrate-binding domain-containing protein [Acidobacteria bacterium]|jgi:Lon protease-like protein|nr:LON peptidase substrate-binding domain-containing protein [Acidobacteriota bacterium]